jgi:hypothetical protein
MVFVPLVECIHYIISNLSRYRHRSLRNIAADPGLRSFGVILVLFVPWILKIMSEFSRLQTSWYFPIDRQLVKSVLGNIFLGYEGTPYFLWQFTTRVSLVLGGFFLIAMGNKYRQKRNGLFFLLLLLPLAVILGISFFKPLYVNRYVIPATVAEIFLIAFAIENITQPLIQKLVAVLSLLFVFGFNLWYPVYNKKPDIRNTILQVNALMNTHDVLLVDNALTLYEAMYYTHDPSRVYWYNPQEYTFPWYVGDVLFTQKQSVNEIPPYPIRAFVVHMDGSYDVAFSSKITGIPAVRTAGNKNTKQP